MSTPHQQAEHDMVVMATDGRLGTVDANVLVDQGTSIGDEMIVVRREDGRLVSVPRSAIDQIADRTIYLSVGSDSLPVMQPPAGIDQPTASASGERLEVSLLEEVLDVGTHTVELGRVRVHKHVEEHIAQHTVGLHSEELEVERVAVNQIVDAMPESYMDGDVLVVPVVEEELVEVVVKRQLRVKEELRIRRVARAIEHTIDVPLRSEQVEITNLKLGDSPPT